MLRRQLFFFFSLNKNTIVSQETLTLHCCCCVAADLTCIQLDLISENREREGGGPPPGEQIQGEAAREEKFKSPAPEQKKRKKTGEPQEEGSLSMENCQNLDFPGGFKGPQAKKKTPPHTLRVLGEG